MKSREKNYVQIIANEGVITSLKVMKIYGYTTMRTREDSEVKQSSFTLERCFLDYLRGQGPKIAYKSKSRVIQKA